MGLKKYIKQDKRIIHGQLLNEHRIISNEISDIKANSYELNEEEKRKVTELQKRQEGLPKVIIDIAWQAQLRLCRRYQRLMFKGKHRNIVVTAIAREMIAYIWAISREVVLTPVNPKLRLSRVPA